MKTPREYKVAFEKIETEINALSDDQARAAWKRLFFCKEPMDIFDKVRVSFLLSRISAKIKYVIPERYRGIKYDPI